MIHRFFENGLAAESRNGDSAGKKPYQKLDTFTASNLIA